MTTKVHHLNKEVWVQVSDGVNHSSFQIVHGTVELFDSPTMPTSTDKGHILKCCINGGLYLITPPTIAWVRAFTDKIVDVIVS